MEALLKGVSCWKMMVGSIVFSSIFFLFFCLSWSDNLFSNFSLMFLRMLGLDFCFVLKRMKILRTVGLGVWLQKKNYNTMLSGANDPLDKFFCRSRLRAARRVCKPLSQPTRTGIQGRKDCSKGRLSRGLRGKGVLEFINTVRPAIRTAGQIVPVA